MLTIYKQTTDMSLKKQMAFLVARQQIWLDLPAEDEEGEALAVQPDSEHDRLRKLVVADVDRVGGSKELLIFRVSAIPSNRPRDLRPLQQAFASDRARYPVERH
jgi:hypothetical protein